MHESREAQGRCRSKGNTASYVSLFNRGINQIAVFYGYQKAGELAETEQQSASAESKSIAEMAVEEIDDDIVKGSDREGNSCSNKSPRVVAPPNEQSEEDIVADL